MTDAQQPAPRDSEPTPQDPEEVPTGQGRFWIIARYILPGFVLGAGVGFWVANSSKVLSEETAVLSAAAGADVALLALTLAAMSFVIAFLDGFFGELIASYGIRNFFFPFVLVAFVSAVAAIVSFAGALDNGTGPAKAQDVLFGAAAWLTVWAIVGAFGLVLTLVFYADERAQLGGIPNKFPGPDSTTQSDTSDGGQVAGQANPDTPGPAASEPKHPDVPGPAGDEKPRHSRRFRFAGPVVALVSIVAIVFAVYWAFQLTRQADIPPDAGAARLLVTGNPFSPTDRFQLGLVTDHPESGYVEYHVGAGCNAKAKNALLMLSGDARLSHPRFGLGSSSVTERAAYVGYPWFSPPQAVQVFDIRVTAMPCPEGVSPSQLGRETTIGGFTQQSFEVAAGSSYALQLPLVGDEANVVWDIPTLGGFWGSPLDLSVSVYAGGLPLHDRIDVARPALTGTGDLSWSGSSFIRPSATWTDLSSASREQFMILLLGALIGIFGSALATVAVDWVRSRDTAKS